MSGAKVERDFATMVKPNVVPEDFGVPKQFAASARNYAEYCRAHLTQPAQAVDVTPEDVIRAWSVFHESRENAISGLRDPLLHMRAALENFATRALAGKDAA